MSDKFQVQQDRVYTKDHEWAKTEGSEVTVGITAFAVDQLGDITLVNVDVKEGDTVTAGKAFGTIESVKTLADLYAPLSGRVVRINRELENKPELVNEDCYGAAWMIAVTPSAPAEKETLLSPAAYGELLRTAEH